MISTSRLIASAGLLLSGLTAQVDDGLSRSDSSQTRTDSSVARTLPYPLKRLYGPAWRYLPPLSAVIDSQVRPRLVAEREATEALVTSGSLYRGLSVTNGQGSVLSGGLDLRLQGKLGENMFVQATLTDRNLPIQPEGNTRTLEELDQVRLAITGPWGSVTAGDFVLRRNDGALSSYTRKLEGLQTTISAPGSRWQFSGALAGSKGRYRSQTIQGVDGRQGPYHLTAKNGSRALFILAGTEKVWLNGILMERGERFDYTIDYETGDLKFTTKHPIREDSRVVADFEYSDLRYSRSTTALGAKWTGKRSSITINALSESDSKTGSQAFSLSSDEIDRLKQEGDADTALVINGATVDSSGGYQLIDDHYEWVGVGAGQFAVAFSHVGASGSYRRLVSGNRLVYQWVPISQRSDGTATYAPHRNLIAPQKQEMTSIIYEVRGKSNNRSLEIESALSRHDLNRLSSLNDADNLSGGYSAEANWKGDLPKSWHYRIMANARRKGLNFEPLGRWDAVELLRDWDLAEAPAEYRWETLNGQIIHSEIGTASIEAGQFDSGDIGTNRLRWTMDRPATNRLNGQFEQSRTSKDDKSSIWTINKANIKYNINTIGPYFTLHDERKTADSMGGFEIQEIGTGVQFGSSNSILSAGISRRDETYDSGRSNRSNLWRFGFNSARGRGIKLESDFAVYRKTVDEDESTADYLLGNFMLRRRLPRSHWWLDLRHRIERTAAETRAILYDSVGVGLGRYRYDPVYDTYVPDEAGDFYRRVLPVGGTEPVVSVQSRIGSEIKLNRWPKAPTAIKSMTEARVALHGKVESQSRSEAAIVVSDPGLSDMDALTFTRSMRVESSMQMRRGTPRYSMTWADNRGLNRLQTDASSNNGELLGDLTQISRWELRRSYAYSLGTRRFTTDARGDFGRNRVQSTYNLRRNQNIERTGIRVSLGTVLSGNNSLMQKLSINLTGRWQNELNRDLSDLNVQFQSANVGLERPVAKSGRLRLDYEQIRIRSDQSIILPLSMGDGFPEGISSRIRAAGRIPLSPNLIMTLSLFQRRASGAEPVRTANIELRSQF